MGTGPTDAIRRVIAAFEQSDWTEIDVRMGDLRVHLSSTDVTAASEPVGHTAAPPPTAPSGDDDRGDEQARRRGAAPADDPTVGRSVPPGTHAVVAPSPGIFWRAPAPGAPPFVEVGDRIEASTTVCIIEVMKLMSHLKADVDGEVVAAFGVDGQAVRTGDPLFAIRPAERGS